MQPENFKAKWLRGVTLLELLLVLAIASTLVVMILNYSTQKSDDMRREKVVMQVEQFLNSALGYYVNTSAWPVTCSTAGTSSPGTALGTTSTLITSNYLPTLSNFKNTYGNLYFLNCTNPPASTFYIYTQANNATNASIIAGRLPMAFVTDQTGAETNPPVQSSGCNSTPLSSGCDYVVSSVAIPGQNLNNARSVNYVGTYSSSACVPAPNCPAGMSPSISVVPVSVNGANTLSCSGGGGMTSPYTLASNSNCSVTVYPIESFTAFAVGGANGVPVAPTSVPDCEIQATPTVVPCLSTNTGGETAGTGMMAGATINDSNKYWRVCLAIWTENKGQVVVTGNSNRAGFSAVWGNAMGAIAAFTRCVPNNGNESPIGSQFNVWQNNSGYKP